MKRITLLIIVIVLISTVPSRAEKMFVAVLDLEPKGVSKILAGAVTDVIRSEMVKTGLYTIIERGRMNEILKEQEFQASGCTDQTCAVQIGKLLSAKKVLLGEINKIGNTFMITVRIVDVEKGTSEFAANEKAASEDKLDVAAKNITISLSQNIVEGNKEFFVERKSTGGYYMRSIVPGWGQFYADRNIEGVAFSGAFVASAAFTVWSYFNYKKKKKAYDDLTLGSTEFDSKYDQYQKASKMYNYSLIALGSIYVLHWVDVVFFAKPEFGKKTENAFIKEGPYMRLVMDNSISAMPEMRFVMGFGYRF